MKFQDVLNKRKSIRKYDPSKKVKKEDLEEIISAAILAPSWKNSQTGRYYIAYSDEAVDMVKKCLPEFNVNRTVGASVYIVTAYVKDMSGTGADGLPATELNHNEWGAYDLGLQNENLLLKAAELGLATLVMGLRDSKQLRKTFNIPDNQIVGPVIAVGYAAGDPKRNERSTVKDIARFL